MNSDNGFIAVQFGPLVVHFELFAVQFGPLVVCAGDVADCFGFIARNPDRFARRNDTYTRGFPIMPEQLLQTPDGLVARSDDFLGVALEPENAGMFNLDAPALASWRAQTDALQVLLDQEDALQGQLAGVRAQIKSQAPELERTARSGLRVAAASPAPDDKKAQAGVTIPKARVNSAPIVPTDLQATPNANGTATLKWNRAGNIRGAKFVIERVTGGGATLLDIVTAAELTIPAKVGESATFQVSARNGQGTSLPSNPAVIYP